MRIVFNLRDQDWQTTKSLGILHVSLRILSRLALSPEIARIDILANASLAPHLQRIQALPKCRIHFSNIPAPHGWSRLMWDHWGIVRTCNIIRPDWLLLPKGFSPLLAWPHCRVSAYVHDNVFGYYRQQRARPFPYGQATLFTGMLRRTARRADLIVTNSDFTAEEVRRDYAPRCRVTRIGAPIANDAPPMRPHSGGSSLLLPTSGWPHKLTTQAIAWLGKWVSRHDYQGTIHGFGSLPSATRWPMEDQWQHHGRIDDERLAQLATRDATLVYFSSYEGYGLPPVEAAAAGRRAVASDLPALRESMPAATLFANDDYSSFERTLSQVLNNAPLPPRRIDTPDTVAKGWLAGLSIR